MVKIRDYHAEYLRRKTRGKHPKEIQKTGKTYPKRRGVGKIPKPKPIPKKAIQYTWNTAYYSSPLKGVDSEKAYFTMSSYDYMKTSYSQYEKKRQKALFKMHKFFEDYVERWRNLYPEPVAFEELRFEYDSEPGTDMIVVDAIRRDQIRFEWVLYDVQSDPPQVQYFIQYQKGQIRRSELPPGFDRVAFVTTIKSWNKWE